jgi:polysaccharide export outer membrane protein
MWGRCVGKSWLLLAIPDGHDAASMRAYTIGPLDRLIIGVFGAAELGGKVQVDAGGKVLLPLVGAVDAVGKTPNELSTMIADRLRGRYVRDPDVSVILDEYNQVITVEGGVQKPGSYPALGNMTLMRAIASGGGLSDSGDTKYVVVFRRAQGRQIAGLYDLRAIHQGMYPDPDIYPNDVVLVGDSAGQRYFQMAVQAGSLLTAPLIAAFR